MYNIYDKKKIIIIRIKYYNVLTFLWGEKNGGLDSRFGYHHLPPVP